MKIKKLFTLTCAFVMALSICVAPASAANVQDTNYYFTNASSTGRYKCSHHRYKEDTSKVYVVPSYSPEGKTATHTCCYVGGQPVNKTVRGTVYLKDDHAYGITNNVREHGDYTTNCGVEMFLNMKPESGSGSLKGVWSPDWTGSGNVTIV